MLWITSDQDFLVQGECCILACDATPICEPGGPPLQAAKFYLINPVGVVKRAFLAPSMSNDGDEVFLGNIHVIVGDALRHYSMTSRGYGHDFELEYVALITGLRSIRPEEISFNAEQVVAGYESNLAQERQQWSAAARAERDDEAEELFRFRMELKGLAGPIQATWEYEPGGWVVKRSDGLVMGRGRARGYGIHVYRKLQAILHDVLGSEFSLETKLTPQDAMSFFPD